jgi:hypothetical protein
MLPFDFEKWTEKRQQEGWGLRVIALFSQEHECLSA